MFKLLALKVSKDCEDYIKKCLQPDVYYYFCTDFRFEVPGKVYRGSKYTKPLPEDFFTVVNATTVPGINEHFTPIINVNAIVGKNGDGKSTIVELIIRMVNNYVVALQQDKKQYTEGRQLKKVDGVAAELYFQLKNDLYKLHITRGTKEIKRIATIVEAQSFDIKEEDAPAEVFASIYTFISNYSHYAYNVYDFRKEWHLNKQGTSEMEKNEACWLFSVFHKNDGYITPISLHPYRLSGNMDINKEAHLSQQRLLYLFLNAPDNTNAFRNILEDKKAIGIQLTQEKYSKFHERSVQEYFLRYEKHESSWEWVLSFLEHMDEELDKNPNRPKYEFKNLWDTYCRPVLSTLAYIIDGEGCKSKHPGQYKEFMESAIKWLDEKYMTEKDSLRDTSFLSNIDSFFSYIDSIRDKTKLKTKGEYLPGIQLKDRYHLYSRYNIRQLARLRTIYDVAMKLHIDPLLCFSKRNLTPADRCRLYMIYKAISIFETYPQYIELYKTDKEKETNSTGIEYESKVLGKLCRKLRKDQKSLSHITRKFSQAENYVKAFRKNGNSDLYSRISYAQKSKYLFSPVKVQLDKLQSHYGAEGITLENLPPAIFETEIIFEKANSPIYMSALSSGERQMLNTIGAIIYHLLNIDSKGTYESINLILEEIELYFHPEYQRRFVMRLIRQIHGANLKHIKYINMTFVTHSPFVLSDIPKCNVLFLKNGAPDYSMQENTFGANIHSMLRNGFFLPNLPMGEFAYRKIDELFRKLNGHQYDEKEIAQIKQEIAVVGEPYLREELYKLLRNY